MVIEEPQEKWDCESILSESGGIFIDFWVSNIGTLDLRTPLYFNLIA